MCFRLLVLFGTVCIILFVSLLFRRLSSPSDDPLTPSSNIPYFAIFAPLIFPSFCIFIFILIVPDMIEPNLTERWRPFTHYKIRTFAFAFAFFLVFLQSLLLALKLDEVIPSEIPWSVVFIPLWLVLVPGGISLLSWWFWVDRDWYQEKCSAKFILAIIFFIFAVISLLLAPTFLAIQLDAGSFGTTASWAIALLPSTFLICLIPGLICYCIFWLDTLHIRPHTQGDAATRTRNHDF